VEQGFRVPADPDCPVRIGGDRDVSGAAQPSALGDAVAARRAVVKLPEVRYAYHVAGNYDYILQVEVADLPAYENFHANRLASLPSVAAVTSYVTMKTLSSPPT
jgi:DNA-binding Lrp family transcriptional regulator